MMPRHLLAEYGAAVDLAQDVYAGTASLADELVVADVCVQRLTAQIGRIARRVGLGVGGASSEGRRRTELGWKVCVRAKHAHDDKACRIRV